MNQPSSLPMVCLLALSLIVCAVFGGPSCTTVAGLLNLTAMTDEEFEAWYPTAAAEIGAAVRQAHRDGTLSAENALASSKKLEDLAAGASPVPHNLADWLGVRGWGALALEVAVIELDAKLDREGAWGEGGKAAKRARVFAGALAPEFAALAPPAPAPAG